MNPNRASANMCNTNQEMPSNFQAIRELARYCKGLLAALFVSSVGLQADTLTFNNSGEFSGEFTRGIGTGDNLFEEAAAVGIGGSRGIRRSSTGTEMVAYSKFNSLGSILNNSSVSLKFNYTTNLTGSGGVPLFFGFATNSNFYGIGNGNAANDFIGVELSQRLTGSNVSKLTLFNGIDGARSHFADSGFENLTPGWYQINLTQHLSGGLFDLGVSLNRLSSDGASIVEEDVIVAAISSLSNDDILGGSQLYLFLGGSDTLTRGVQAIDELSYTGFGNPVLIIAPSNLNATAFSNKRIDLTWSDNSNNETSFRLQRRQPGGSWLEIATIPVNTKLYSDTGLSNETTYQYRILASNTEATSNPSNMASATTLGEPIPSIPSSLVASASFMNQVDLSWVDTSDNEEWFVLQRKVGNGGFVDLVTLAQNSSSYLDKGLSPSTNYTYRVSSANASGGSTPSKEAAVTTPSVPVPAAPSELQSIGFALSSLTLSWLDNANDETGYRIERKVGTGQFAQIGELPAGSTSFIDTDVKELKTYYYLVYAYNNNGVSAFSNLLEVKFPFFTPSNLSATPVSSDQVNLAWSDNSGVETSYRVERRTGNGSYVTIVNVGEEVSAFTDMTVMPETNYSYRVQGISFGYFSEYTNVVSITTPALLPPLAPSKLVIASQGLDHVKLNWTDRSDDETGFLVERSTGNGSYESLATLDSGTTSFTDAQVSELGRYSYRVSAINEAGFSSSTNVVSAQIPFSDPVNLSALAVSSEQVDLLWNDKSAVETGYRIERKISQGDFEVLKTVAANSNSYSDTDVSPLTSYTYRVIAVNGTENSSPTNQASAITPNIPVPGSVDGLVAVLEDAFLISLNWNDNSIDEYGFRIERMVGSGDWTPLFATASNTTSFQDLDIGELQTFSYRIVAFNDAGESSASNVASVIVPFNQPTDLTAQSSGESRIDLTWNDNSLVESGYRVERKQADGAFEALTTLDPGSVSYVDETALVDVTYTYRVFGLYEGGESSPSNEASASYTANVTNPIAPTQLTANAVSYHEIQLTWVDNSDNESGFRIERRKGVGGTFEFVGNAAADTTAFRDKNLEPNTTYYYRMVSYINGARSSETTLGDIFATTQNVPVPEIPSELALSSQSSGSVVLSWTDTSSIEAGFKIQRKIGQGAFEEIATVNQNTTLFNDTGIEEFQSYAYRIHAFNESGDSGFSNEVQAVIPLSPPLLLAGNVVSSTEVQLSWVDDSSIETGFGIQRAQDGQNWVTLDEVGRNKISYTDKTAQPDTTYSYRAVTLSFGKESGYSNAINVTTFNITPPTAPSGLEIQALSNTSISVAWADNSEDELGFSVFRKEASSDIWIKIADVIANVNLYVDNGVLPGVKYSYGVTAFNNGGSEAPVQSDFRIPIPGRLINISTRGLVETGSNVMIGSFIIQGNGPKTVLIRGIGPSLASSLNTEVLNDPELTLVSGVDLDRPVAFNDNWRDTDEEGIKAVGLVPLFEEESAIVISLQPGAYSAILSGVNYSSGFGLIEVYEVDFAKNTRMINISTRTFVQTGDKRMIGGFIIKGDTPARVFIRATGPSLDSSIQNRLLDPVIELYAGQKVLIANDNWQDSAEIADIIASGIPPLDLREPAIVATLAPGLYTAVVGGANGTSGYGLLEIYDYPEKKN
jgi:uncharacterized protein